MNFLKVGDHLNRKYTVTLEIDDANRVVNFVIRWQKILKQWTISIFDVEGNQIASHLPLLCGIDGLSADLLRIYAYKMFGSMAIFPLTDELWGVDPSKENLPNDYMMIWGDST